MAARADLLAVAERQAATARENAEGNDLGGAGALARDAKVTLEAAALAESMPAGAVDRALDSIQGLLAEAGVLDEALELPAEEFLDRTFRALLAWRKEALAGAGVVEAYSRLRVLAEGLERDFTAAATPTAQRLAARIHTALEDADDLTGGAPHGEEQQA